MHRPPESNKAPAGLRDQGRGFVTPRFDQRARADSADSSASTHAGQAWEHISQPLANVLTRCAGRAREGARHE